MTKKNEVKPLSKFENNLTILLDRGVDAIPSGVNADRLKLNALMAISQDKALMAVAKSQPMQVAQHVYNFVVQGLDMGNREAYIVPFAGKLTPVIDYRGEKKIAMQYSVKPIKIIKSGVVYENDNFGFDDEREGRFYHRYNPFKPKTERGEKVGAYCTIEYEDGSFQDVFVDKEEIEKVKGVSKASKSPYSPWTQWEESMWEKTVIRKAMNRYIQLDFRSTEVMKAYQESSSDVEFGNQRTTLKSKEDVEEVEIFDAEFEDEEVENVSVNKETGEVVIDIE